MPEASDTQERIIAPVPRVAIQAFCETAEVAAMIESAAADRRMQKAHIRIQTGGSPAAAEAYRQAPTPNVIIIEAQRGGQADFLGHLDALAEFCDAGTKVVVLGHVNDVQLYRELMRRGVSEYLIAPVPVIEFVRVISELFTAPGADPVGRTVAVVGAKGGVGSSTVAHNLAWAFARDMGTATVIVDFDVAFGTAGLDFNQDPPQGIAEALFAPDRLDANLVDRLLSKCSDNLSLLAAPAVLDRVCDLTETAADGLIDILRGAMPCIVLDMPHIWTAWARRTLMSADEIIIVAAPELASLRNAKNLFETLKANRQNDRKPRVVLNQSGMPKRPEIAPAEFAKGLSTELSAVLPFDAQLFGTAANNGQMIAEVQANSKVAEAFVDLAAAVIGRAEMKRPRGTLLDPLLARFARKRAS